MWLRPWLVMAAFVVAPRVVAAEPSVRFYVDGSLWAGHLWGETDYGSQVIDEGGLLVAARYTLGVDIGPPELLNARIGAAFDFFGERGDAGAAAGIAAAIDYPVASCWRLGVRAQGSANAGAPMDGQLFFVGARLQNPNMIIGADVMFVDGNEGLSSTGRALLLGAGLGPRPKKYTLAITGGLAAVIVIGAFAILGRAQS